MNYQIALKNYTQDKSKENLKKQVDLLVKEMTLSEKIKMLMGDNFMKVMIKGLIKEKRVYNIEPLTSAGCKRLGIPNGIKFSDGPRGIVMGHSTCFPVSMLRGASFDDALEYEIGQAMADELVAQGANYFGGICINLVRHPKWGRSQETYGEDQILLGNMGVALTRAMQEKGVIACPKHYALNSIEDLRFYIDVKIKDRALYEVYLPHFKKCVDAGALSVMGAYNKMNGEYCCANKRLMTDILRDEWGFDGLTISDFVWGVTETIGCINAGLDIEMPMGKFYKKLKAAVKKGDVKEESITRSVKDIISVCLRMEGTQKETPLSVVACKKHTELARYAATQGMVLLENNGILPLSPKEKVLVCGDYADTVNSGDHGSSSVHSPYYVTAYQGLKNKFNNVSLFNCSDVTGALENAKNSDVAIVNIGFDHKNEGEFVVNSGENLTAKPAGKGGDRDNLSIYEKDIKLLKSLKENGKKVIAVLYSGGAVMTEDFRDYCDAIIMNFYSGMEGGNALCDIVCGDVNPSGKMPMTVAKTESDYPSFKHIGDRPYEIEYGYYHGYTLFEKESKEARYPFGFGLSYTKFEISNLSVQNIDNQITVTVDVKNVGKLWGKEVVQVYFGGKSENEDRAIKQLKAYKKLELAPGETKKVDIVVLKDDLKFYNENDKTWSLDKEYTIFVGNDSVTANSLKTMIELENI